MKSLTLTDIRRAGERVFSAGGATIYRQTLPMADAMYLSIIKADHDGDNAQYDEAVVHGTPSGSGPEDAADRRIGATLRTGPPSAERTASRVPRCRRRTLRGWRAG